MRQPIPPAVARFREAKLGQLSHIKAQLLSHYVQSTKYGV
jgi:hypothetical protein